MHVFCNSLYGAAEHRLSSALASFDDDDDVSKLLLALPSNSVLKYPVDSDVFGGTRPPSLQTSHIQPLTATIK